MLLLFISRPTCHGVGWKNWAMHAGLQLSATLTPAVPHVLFTDGDSEHSPDGLRRLVAGAEQGEFDLTSLMVHL
jgi:hypothetical protein